MNPACRVTLGSVLVLALCDCCCDGCLVALSPCPDCWAACSAQPLPKLHAEVTATHINWQPQYFGCVSKHKSCSGSLDILWTLAQELPSLLHFTREGEWCNYPGNSTCVAQKYEDTHGHFKYVSSSWQDVYPCRSTPQWHQSQLKAEPSIGHAAVSS